jgi:MFS family permease
VNRATAEATAPAVKTPRPGVIISALGTTQILVWGSSYYLLAVLAKPIADDTGWPFAWVIGGVSIGLLIAGLVSPRVGDSIERNGGRPVLAASAILLALGSVGLALAQSLAVYLVAWLVLGCGMGAGLYDAAFATLGRLYGERARTAITTLTLFGGFASTACWPISAFLVSEVGWRGACLAYAAIHLGVVLPLYVFVLPKEGKRHIESAGPRDDLRGRRRIRGPIPAGSMPLFVVLAAAITLGSMISTLLSVHLLTILQARGIALAAAVALGATVGPSQVGARTIEMLISRFHHPIWTIVAATILVATGIGALWVQVPMIAAALVLYGAGIGLESIARGTLPLAFFGEQRYPAMMGRIAMPSLIAQAVSPSIGALLLDKIGYDGTLLALVAAAIVDVLLVAAVFILMQQRGASSPMVEESKP